MRHIGLVFGIKPQQGCAFVEYEHGVCCAERSQLGDERFAQLQPGTWIAFECACDECIDSFELVPSGNPSNEPSRALTTQNRPTAWH